MLGGVGGWNDLRILRRLMFEDEPLEPPSERRVMVVIRSCACVYSCCCRLCSLPLA